MGAISIESALSRSPYTNDVKVEMARLKSEGVSEKGSNKSDNEEDEF